MADRVQLILEDMAPALEDLRKRELFSSEELRIVVKSRTDFEYLINRRSPEKEDFLRYINYEINFEALRRKRKSRLKQQRKTSVSEWAGVRHIHYIFERALLRLKGDISVWMYYFDFCEQTDARHQLGKAFARAIVLHPNNIELWIRTASYEYNRNQNMSAARTLFQRGLRLNKESKLLWLEYYRCEWLYVLKLRERRRILHTADEDSQSEGAPSQEDPAADALGGLEVLLSGSLPRVVYQNAVNTIANDLPFRLDFVPIARELGDTVGEEHAIEILEACVTDFPSLPGSWKAWAESATDFDTVVQRFERGISSMKENVSGLFGEYANWLVVHSSQNIASLVKSLCVRADEAGEANVMVYASWIQAVLNNMDSSSVAQSVSDALNIASKAIESHSSSLDAWKLCLKVMCNVRGMKLFLPDSLIMPDIASVFRQALQKISLSDSALLWIDFAQYVSGPGLDRNEVHMVFSEGITALNKPAVKEAKDELCIMYTNWCFGAEGLTSARKIFDKITLWKPVSLTILNHYVKFEQDVLKNVLIIGDINETVARVRTAFELAVTEYGNTNTDIWLDYISFEDEMKDFAKSSALYSRAVRFLTDSTDFVQRMQLRRLNQ